MNTTTSSPPAVIEVRAAELLGPGVVACPHASQQLWNQHPKVYIDVVKKGEGRCPYCGTVYRLKAGEQVAHGH
jgi:uncharacterized Zn-finger protein